MADDNVTYEVITDYVNRGIATSLTEINRYKAALAALVKQNKVAEQQAAKTLKALNDLHRGLKSGAVKAASSDFGKMVQQLDAASRGFKKLAQAQRTGGSLSPAKSAAGGLNIQTLREDVATYEALNANYISEAKKRIAAEDKMEASAKALRKAQADRLVSEKNAGASSNLTKEEQATEKLAKANRDLAAAKRASTAARKTGDSAQIAAALDKQAAATRRVTAAQERLYHTQAMATKGSANLHAQLPRLRYALYDVAATAGIVGAALTAMAGVVFFTAARMDRQFADVVRTSQATGDQVTVLRNQFIDLFQTLPASWANITQIGTLGGQLGIASTDLARFTELVTKFSATTNVSVEEAATAFGRLSKLLDVPAAKFENLGSSILKVGVNSVATESQIITVSSQIASIASLAGFTADQVVGLSGALSSLGVQPELARGTITRLFTNIAASISSGSTRLEEFGRLTGKTAEEFSTAWGKDAAGTLQQLLTSISKMDNSTAISTLKDLGIVAARDIPTILKLAQNTDVLTSAMQDAASGFADASTLNQQYGVIADTLSAKIQVLGNNFQALLATMGQSANSSPVKALVDSLSKFLGIVTELINNPISAWVLGGTVALVGLGGVLLVVGSALLRVTGTVLGARTAMVEYDKVVRETALDMGLYASATSFGSKTTAELAAEVVAAKGGMTGLATSTKAATLAIRGLKIASVVGIALLALDAVFTALASHSSSANAALQETANIFKDALSQDAVSSNDPSKVFRDMSATAPEAKTATEDLGKAVNDSSLEFAGLKVNTDSTTQSLQDMVVAMGAVTDQAVSQNIAKLFLGSSDDVAQQTKNLENIKNGFFALKVNVEDVKNAIKTGDTKFFDDLINKTSTSATNFGFLDAKTQSAYMAVNLFAKQARDSTDALNLAAQQYLLAGDAASTAGVAVEDSGAGFQQQTQDVEDAIASITDYTNAAVAVQSSLYSLGQSLQENGNSWSEYSASGRANIGAVLDVMDQLAAQTPGDAASTASSFQGLFDALVSGGYASASQLDFLRQVILTLTATAKAQGVQSIAPALFDTTSLLAGFGDSAQKAATKTKNLGNAANRAAKEIRTLKDYVSDLKSVSGDAFDFRFGLQISKDDATSAIHDITASFAEAKKQVRDLTLDIQDLQATLGTLSASRDTLEYFLSVAINYGDANRITELQAELAKNASDTAKANSDLTDKQKEVSQAQQESTATATGNSDAAIEQRKKILDLVKAVEDQISAYAAQGHSSKEVAAYASKLKGQLESQLRAWGYNTKEIKTYTAAITDFITIINRVPRNLTVEANANTDPAQKALDIFFAKNKDRTINTTQKINTVYNGSGDAKKARADAINAKIAVLKKLLLSGTGSPGYYKALADQIDALSKKLSSGKYYSGGFTGRGGRLEPAGIVHKGEYVVPKSQVNQSTGLPYMDSMGRLPASAPGGSSYASGGFVTGNGTLGPIDLSALTIQQIARAVQPYLVVDGKVIAGSASKAFAEGTRTGGN